MKNDINFLFEIGSLRNVQRGWRQHLGTDCANVLDHTIRVIWLALIISRMEKAGDENKIMRMALVHDISETRISDLSYVQKAYLKPDDKSAAKDSLSDTMLSDFYTDFFVEYEERKSIEAKIVKDADNLEVDLELKELVERGSKLPEKWKDLRRLVREEKLYTESAKKIWDEIQNTDVADWHLKSNKWIKIPEAGL
jgi:putative hydrolases of HD superfamily